MLCTKISPTLSFQSISTLPIYRNINTQLSKSIDTWRTKSPRNKIGDPNAVSLQFKSAVKFICIDWLPKSPKDEKFSGILL